MTNQFSVINNPHFNGSGQGAAAGPHAIERSAQQLLAGRQFHVCGDNIFTAAPHISPYTGGVFVVGPYAHSRIRKLRPLYPSVPFIAEPLSVTRYWATEDEPFFLGGNPDDLIPATLDWNLSFQIMDGSAVAMTPTGQIRTGDYRTIKAALAGANAIVRDDVIFVLPLEAGWLSSTENVRLVTRVIDRSDHPVALAFADKKNPLESVKRMRAYRQIIAETTGAVVAYRTDLFGFDALAHGAIASAIGAYPSVRRLTPVGATGAAIDPEDMAPHMLVGDMLRFVRTKTMRRIWFANATPFVCFCAICAGQPIDRLFGDDHDRKLGHSHNVIEIGRLHDATVGLTQAQIAVGWANQVAGAFDTYPQLESHIGRPVEIAKDLPLWAEAIR